MSKLNTRVTRFITATNTNGAAGLSLIHEAIVHAFANRGETSQLSRLCFDLNPSDNSRMKKILSAVVEGAKVNKNKETGEQLITFKNASVKGQNMGILKALVEQSEGFRNAYVKEMLFPSVDTAFEPAKYLARLFKVMDKEGITIAELDRAYAAHRATKLASVAVVEQAA